MTADSIIGSRQPLMQTSLLSLLTLWSLSSQKKLFTLYVIVENNNIYISDIIISNKYITDNPWKRDTPPRGDEVSFFRFYRENERKKLPPEPKRRCALSLLYHKITKSHGVGVCDKV